MLITEINRDDTGYVLTLVDYNEDIYTTGAYPTYTRISRNRRRVASLRYQPSPQWRTL
jgi:hypothetical protein